MLHSKLIDIFKSFTEEDVKDFREYLESPFFNKSKSLIKFYEIVIKYYPDFGSKKLTKEAIFKKLYPAKSYNDERMRNIISDLYHLCENYIAYTGLKYDYIDRHKNLLRGLRVRGLKKQFHSQLNKAYQELEEGKIKDDIYFLNKFILDEELLTLLSRDYLTIDNSLQQNLLDDFKNFSVAKSLKIVNVMVNETKRHPEYKFNFELLDLLGKYIKEHYETNPPIIQIYYNQLMLLSSDDTDEFYFKLKKLLKTHHDILSELDLKNMYVYLVNYLVTKSERTGEPSKYSMELMDIYEEILIHKIYTSEDYKYFDHLLFDMMVDTSLKTGNTGWAKDFIKKYSELLSENTGNNCYYRSCAALLFKQKLYEQSLEMLSKIVLPNWRYKLEIKIISFQNYYELGLFDVIMTHTDAYKHYLASNKKISQRVLILHKNFVELASKLVRAKTGNKYDTKKLKKEIEFSKNVAKHDWLIEKANELIEIKKRK